MTQHTHKHTHIVIMAGGIGSRFWPISTPEYPKQFIDILGVGKTLLQLAVERLLPLCSVEHIWVVTNAKYAEIVKKQIPAIPEENILKEPVARNTAPCIAYACWKIKKQQPDANIVVTPSDAIVLDTIEYQRIIRNALRFVEANESILTIGIQPTRPETGYGYIAAQGNGEIDGIYKVDSFKEKPDLQTAERYITAGNYYWNAGIFVWKAGTIEQAIRNYQPRIALIMDELSGSFFTEREESELKRLFPTCDKISIDYAVMEKAHNIFVAPGDFGWSDLGSWGSVQSHVEKDKDGNAVVGNGISLYECQNCMVSAADASRLVVQGLKDYIVAEKEGRILICALKEEQRIKDFEK